MTRRPTRNCSVASRKGRSRSVFGSAKPDASWLIIGPTHGMRKLANQRLGAVLAGIRFFKDLGPFPPLNKLLSPFNCVC